MPKQPLFLDDIIDILDPLRLRNRIDASIATPGDIKEWVYKLTRTLAELLKATIELNENVKVMTEEIRSLREAFEGEFEDEEDEEE
ncbi:MAG: hypothetical protein DRP11_04035 [Candidatus Aenigmatarchaeota archaeon]|nr:MAG: hypothetical protein DRP11_04035 [Candidatus Aenigmarchaeota archaeon]